MKNNYENDKLMTSGIKERFGLFVAIVFFFALLSSVPVVHALGLAPAYKTVIISETTTEYDLRIMNEGGVAQSFELTIVGDLSEYIILSKSRIDFQQGQTQQDIQVTVAVPKNTNLAPGEYVARILLKEKTQSGSGMMAVVGVASRVEMVVPGEGALLKSTLFTPNFKKDTPNAFSVEVKNLGGKDATNCKAIVEVMTALNVKADSIVSSTMNIPAGGTQKFTLSWTPNVGAGNYLAKSSVICDNGETGSEGMFAIGSPELRIINFDSEDFRLGGISKFDLIVGSDWPEEIKGVEAQVDIIKEGKKLYTAKTENKDISPNGKAIFPVFLDTTNMAPGQYVIFVTLKYLDTELEQAYTSYFAQDEFVLESLSGMVVGGDKNKANVDEGGGNNTLLIIVIIFILVVNVVLVFKLLKRKDKK